MGGAGEREEAWDRFLTLWEELVDDSNEPGTVIVVEGERDLKALRRLGIDGPIVPLHRGERLAGVARRLSVSALRVILLTDWDAEGGQLARRLRELLEAGPAEVDLETRKRLARCLRGELVHVEGLFAWARRNAESHGAGLEHFRPGALNELASGPGRRP